ncbi:ABC transporter substrate-binding protein [Arthrobacter sp. FW306-2-2C-D06B]|uniref:ABC transporter substrate-binding protein n=1 Tax=Arthrobacter sp. FW306-2-2C-D06B TaxID=2879618 RepID=UPI001F3D9B14|nr:extracellular solute-binding protein [Arthrobacter sp. FW306-2-2C-D06B]UKA60412.1 extracellular solute-binding protein [Arthrobacter sp. FW306-2-2C-D06B]
MAIAGCGAGGGASSGAAGASTDPVTTTTVAAWNDIVKKANSEGKVTFYTSLTGMNPVVSAFEKAYPDIKVTVQLAPTSDLVSRLDQEISIGAKGADVAFHSSTGWFDKNYTENNFAGLQVSPEAASAGWNKLLANKSYATVYGYPFTLAYSTTGPGPVSSVQQLVDSNPHAKVGLVSPSVSPVIAFYYDTLRKTYGDQILAKLAKTNFSVQANNLLAAQGVGSGEYDYAVPAIGSQVSPLIASGAKVAQTIPTTATSGVFYDSAVLKNAPNPNAAQVFMNFLMSQEADTQFVKSLAPATVPLKTDGAVPWSDVQGYNPNDWTTEKWNAWIAKYWTPLFGK